MLIPILINLLAFVGVFLAIFAVGAIVSDMRWAEMRKREKQIEDELRQLQRMRVAKDISQLAAEVRGDEEAKPGPRQRLQTLVEQSGLRLTVGRLVAISAALTVLTGLAAGLLTRNMLFASAAAAVGAWLPIFFVRFKRHQRIEQIRGQLPDAFELMARVVRSGQTVTQAMQAVAEEFSQPISLEFLACYEQMNLGMAPETAMRELGRRTGLLEVKIFVLAVLVHRQTGGNMAQLLDKLAAVVRERFRIDGMIRSLTAQGRLQAGILMALPPFMFTLLMIMHPDYERELLNYPMLIVLALSMMTVGWLWVRKIVNFDY